MIIGGKEVRTGETAESVKPHQKEHVLASYHTGGAEHVQQAIDAAREAHKDWSRTPWEERASVFLRAAELLAGPWRDTLNAATMLGQSKTVHQAEIDAACELIDFWRFNAAYMRRLMEEQPLSGPGVWNRSSTGRWRASCSRWRPFNFTSITGNLATAPALMGNTVSSSPRRPLSTRAYFVMKLLEAAGLPPGVINFVLGSGSVIGDAALTIPELAGIHFTGSTRGLPVDVEDGRRQHRALPRYPRIVGETGGKDFIFAHPSRRRAGAGDGDRARRFEYQGQKCSAASRVYVPASLWPQLRESARDRVRRRSGWATSRTSATSWAR